MKKKSKEKRYRNLYMQVAHQVAKMSFCERLKVGAIAVKDGRIISMGWNGQPSGFDNCCEDDNNYTLQSVLHAESNLLMKIARSNETSDGAVVYTTHAPCVQCAKLIHQAGVTEVYYEKEYRETEGLQFLEKCKIKTIKLSVK